MNQDQDKNYWQAKATRFNPCFDPIIDGRKQRASGSQVVDKINPANGVFIYSLPEGGKADVDQAVAAARKSLADGRWRGMAPLLRKSVLLRLADLVEQNQEELALMDCLEMGKPISDALGDVMIAAGFFRFYAECIDKAESSVVPSEVGALTFNLLEPVGVVGAIVPWNYPVINAALKAAPILAAGNSLVLKPSEIATLSAVRLAELALEAGMPDGVFNVVPGLGATVGAAIAGHDDVDMVTFTGATLTGRKIMAAAAQSNGKRIALECGGKSPQLVLHDVGDIIEEVAAVAVQEAFANQGQLCVARTRLIVAEQIKDDLLEAMVRQIKLLVPRNPLDPETRFGAIASRPQWTKIKSYIECALSEGAESIGGGIDIPDGAGCFVPPVILEGLPVSSRVVREEIFGPVLTVHSFRELDCAVRLANDSTYGLAATAWCRDAGISQELARRLDAGKITLRSSARASMKAGFSLAAEPFKESGFGIEMGMAGMRGYSRLKAIEMIA